MVAERRRDTEADVYTFGAPFVVRPQWAMPSAYIDTSITRLVTGSGQPRVVQIAEETQVLLDELVALENEPAANILHRALMAFWTERLFATSRTAVAALRSDSDAWQAYQQEVASLNGTLADGLTDEPEDV